MTKITPDKVRRDNSNIFAFSFDLFRELRKEKFRKPKIDDRFVQFSLNRKAGEANPYPDLDFRMDIDRFMENLEDEDYVFFSMFMMGFSQTEMMQETGLSQPSISLKISRVIEKFKRYYLEGESEDEEA